MKIKSKWFSLWQSFFYKSFCLSPEIYKIKEINLYWCEFTIFLHKGSQAAKIVIREGSFPDNITTDDNNQEYFIDAATEASGAVMGTNNDYAGYGYYEDYNSEEVNLNQ